MWRWSPQPTALKSAQGFVVRGQATNPIDTNSAEFKRCCYFRQAVTCPRGPSRTPHLVRVREDHQQPETGGPASRSGSALSWRTTGRRTAIWTISTHSGGCSRTCADSTWKETQNSRAPAG
jgi:hypothetical protein